MNIVVLDGYRVNPGDLTWEACPDYCFWDYPLIELAGSPTNVVN